MHDVFGRHFSFLSFCDLRLLDFGGYILFLFPAKYGMGPGGRALGPI